jgi:hypothetical protein
MFFLWGRRNCVLKKYNDVNSKCEKCDSRSLNYIVKQHYYHFMWIPVIPVHKFVGTYCDNCKSSRQEVFSEIGAKYDKQSRTPIYMYSFIFLVLIFIAFIIMYSNQKSNERSENIKNPLIGDVYCYKFKDEQSKDAYSFIKVVNFTKDSVFFYQSNLYYNQYVGEYSSSGYFVKELYGQSRLKIIEMYNQKEIVDIYRDYDRKYSWFNNEKEKEIK